MGRALLYISAGACVATGVLSLFFSFGMPWGTDIATSLDQVGWDAVSRITPSSTFVLALMCFGLGVPTLIALNATAYKETGGY
jgi:hypothetical protein